MTTKSLVAPPRNPELSTVPNKTQTIVNVVRAEGPIARARLHARMRELLGAEEATDQMIAPLVYQLTMTGRIEKTDDGLFAIPRIGDHDDDDDLDE